MGFELGLVIFSSSDATGRTIGVLGFYFRRELGIFLFTTASRGSGVRPASYLMGTTGSFPGDKAAGA